MKRSTLTLLVLAVLTVWNIALTDGGKATPNKFPVSRPELMEDSMRAGGPFSLFHYFLNGSETS